MVKHIVCFKLKNNSPEEKEKAASVLSSMEGKVPQVLEMHVGIDFLCSERSYDIILEVVVKDRDALDAYQHDPYHCGTVKPYMHAVRESSIAVDYEF